MALSKKAKKIEKAYKELQYLSQDKEAREEYDAYQRLKIDEKMKIQYAEEKGMKSGIIKIAKKMIEKNMDIETIKELTNLTEQEIQNIKNK